GKVILVKQYRHPVRRITYELPAGKLDVNESPLKCIKREFEEETGYRFSSCRKLISYNPTPAFSNEVIHIYELNGIKRGRFKPDIDEFIEVVELPLNKVVNMIYTQKISDSKTIIGIFAYLIKKFNKKLRSLIEYN
ncbi:MAG: NUDIX hydrolase, partial [bacterium]|nr:NUDIX hydrolase [bacterium]